MSKRLTRHQLRTLTDLSGDEPLTPVDLNQVRTFESLERHGLAKNLGGDGILGSWTAVEKFHG